MPYYWTCPYCGANLDPGEKCDCKDNEKEDDMAAPSPAPAPTAGQTSAAPGNTPAPTVPVAGAPTYTLDQISRAGASLVDAGKMQQLLELLGRYGVQAVTQLQPEQYGAFATELRALGAQI